MCGAQCHRVHDERWCDFTMTNRFTDWQQFAAAR
jgi:hypothetical protein